MERILLLSRYLIRINRKEIIIPDTMPNILIKGMLGETGTPLTSAGLSITKLDTNYHFDHI